MFAHQGKFDFPVDDRFWAVKYIDQFTQAHARTRTAAVRVMLQCLPIGTTTALARMTAKAAKDLLGRRGAEPKQNFDFVSILVGALPGIRIGDVYRNGEKVGELPSVVQTIELAPGQTDSIEARGGDTIEPPPDWGAMPYRVLNASEYSGISDHSLHGVSFSKSRLAYFRQVRNDGGTDTFVVPRMTIFKAFYANHSVLANMFCAGPWEQKVHQAISFTRTLGGAQTGVADNGSRWDIVLQTLIQDEYAGVLAVLYFDQYGRTRANSIHTRALQERHHDQRAAWYASAEIPLQAIHEKLKLSVKCLQLRSWRNPVTNGPEHHKFLVTEICGSSWPSHYPTIARTRTNAGEGSAMPEPVPLPAPFRGTPPSKQGSEDTLVRPDLDAHTSSSTTIINGSQWVWLDDGPSYQKLHKEHSQRYQGGMPDIDTDGTQVSPGAHTSGKDALPKAEIKTLVRAPNERFGHMYQAFNTLVDKNVITGLAPVPAGRPRQRAERTGFECWSFIDDESLRRELGPRGGFRTVYDIPRNRRSAHWRTALVLRFNYRQQMHHWIEIECNHSSSFRSLLLTFDHGQDANYTIETALNAIAEVKGIGIEEAVRAMFHGAPIKTHAYTHRYKEDGTLREDLLQAFLERSVTSLG
jgi:hypothetical protein